MTLLTGLKYVFKYKKCPSSCIVLYWWKSHQDIDRIGLNHNIFSCVLFRE